MLPNNYLQKYKCLKGIYRILNLTTGKFYIGSSVNIARRWEAHWYDLENNIHNNSYLQNAWNKYGKDDFSFEVLKILPEETTYQELLCWEQYYLNDTECYRRDIGYNISKHATGGGIPMTLDNVKAGKSKRINYEQYLEIINLLCNTDMPLIEISRMVNVSNAIVKSIYERKVLYEETKEYKFVPRISIYRKIELEHLDEIKELNAQGMFSSEIAQKYDVNCCVIKHILSNNNIPFNSQCIAVYKYSLSGEYLDEYKSIGEANKLNNISNGKISDVINGNRQSAGGYRWSLIKTDHLQISKIEELTNKTSTSRRHPIIQYDLDWNPIAIYESGRQISVGSPSIIRNICKQKSNNVFKNSHWRYAVDANESDLDCLLKKKYEIKYEDKGLKEN